MKRIAELVRYDDEGTEVPGGLRVELESDDLVALSARRVRILVDANELMEAVAHVMGWPGWPMLAGRQPEAGDG